jgi:hypothetical protein
VPKPRRSDRHPALRIEAESTEPPPRHAKGGESAPRSVNDKAPVTFDEGPKLPVHNPHKPFLSNHLVRNGPLLLVNMAGAVKNAVGGPRRSPRGPVRDDCRPPSGAQPVFKYSVPGLLMRPRRSPKLPTRRLTQQCAGGDTGSSGGGRCLDGAASPINFLDSIEPVMSSSPFLRLFRVWSGPVRMTSAGRSSTSRLRTRCSVQDTGLGSGYRAGAVSVGPPGQAARFGHQGAGVDRQARNRHAVDT